MNAERAFVILAFTVVVFCIQGAQGIKCFVCENCSVTTNLTLFDCTEWCNVQQQGYFILLHDMTEAWTYNVTQDNGTFCPPKFNACRQLKQTVKSDIYTGGKPVDTVVRVCAFLPENGTDEPYIFRSSATTKREVYTCWTDACNSALSLEFCITFIVFGVLCVPWFFSTA